jgi:hypothetical protein
VPEGGWFDSPSLRLGSLTICDEKESAQRRNFTEVTTLCRVFEMALDSNE